MVVNGVKLGDRDADVQTLYVMIWGTIARGAVKRVGIVDVLCSMGEPKGVQYNRLCYQRWDSALKDAEGMNDGCRMWTTQI